MVAGLASTIQATGLHSHTHTASVRAFKIGEETIDFNEIPDLPDPVSYEVEMKKDEKTVEEMKDELHSALINADKGSLQREMSQALVQDIKGKLSLLDQHYDK